MATTDMYLNERLLQPLDGNSSDQVSLLAAIQTIQAQLCETGEEASVYAADNGGYSQSNMQRLNQTRIKWVSQVSETLTEAKNVGWTLRNSSFAAQWNNTIRL